MRQRVGANSSKKNKGRVNFTMKEGKHISKSPFLQRGTGNWSLCLCNFQGQDRRGFQFGGISLPCVSCNKATQIFESMDFGYSIEKSQK